VPRILNLGTRRRWVQLHVSGAYPQGNLPRYPLDRRLGGPQSRSGRGREEKNSQPPPGNRTPESRSSSLYLVCMVKLKYTYRLLIGKPERKIPHEVWIGFIWLEIGSSDDNEPLGSISSGEFLAWLAPWGREHRWSSKRWFFSPLNHLTRLIARENFITVSIDMTSRWYHSQCIKYKSLLMLWPLTCTRWYKNEIIDILPTITAPDLPPRISWSYHCS
jgi:hypothetical protein